MNLDGLMLLARLAENVGVDLWNYRTGDGRSIRNALEYLHSYANGERQWTHQQIGGSDAKLFFPLMRRASAHYRDQKFRAAQLKIPAADPADRERLLSGK